MIEKAQLKAGMVIAYLLRPEDRPVNPEKPWRGKITRVTFDTPFVLDHVEVESLEPDYEGERERVYLPQIIEVLQ
ncbi:MAG TPA: hypothetical protein VFA41_07770 [Ktedonobacteraceae bacterium]|jgi:hypothetical protein|nr:hypothetical protein [Ktedonobacteraceae bacterium]